MQSISDTRLLKQKLSDPFLMLISEVDSEVRMCFPPFLWKRVDGQIWLWIQTLNFRPICNLHCSAWNVKSTLSSEKVDAVPAPISLIQSKPHVPHKGPFKSKAFQKSLL